MRSTIFEGEIGDHGLNVRIRVHPDSPGEFEITLIRHGLTETHCESATELRLLGEAIRLAGLKALEEEAK